MKLFSKILYIVIFLVLFAYVNLPEPQFPAPPEDSIQSNEPADIESPLRRGYYTDYTRQEVMNHYKKEFSKPTLFDIPFVQYSFNYPPEESQTIIRDQTKSTFLEEIVHPFRESIYINGFEPLTEQYAIVIDNKVWRQKVIVKYSKSNTLIRVLVVFLLAISTLVITKELTKFVKEFKFKHK